MQEEEKEGKEAVGERRQEMQEEEAPMRKEPQMTDHIRPQLRRPAMCELALAALFVSVLVGTAGAAPGDLSVRQVANISPGGGSSVPSNLTNVNGTLFFSADDGSHGSELWKSNGSTATMVADINPAAGVGSSPTQLTNVNGTLFFAANDGTNGQELWKSTGAGATMVANIKPASGSSAPTDLTAVGGTLFFAADDGTDGTELWKSNGGALGAGTDMVANIDTVGTGSYPEELTNVNGTLFFGATDDTHGEELWKSNGGALGAGTDLVADINPVADTSSSPGRFANINGTLFFQADDGTNGAEVWKSNGGALGSGTAMVADINPTAGEGSGPRYFTDVSGIAFFQADDGTNGTELWKSDGGGLGSGTEMVADINPSGGSEPFALTNVGGTLFFAAYEPTHGQELWKSNGGGLGAGTDMVADINPAAGAGSFPDPPSFAGVNGNLFFSATDGAHGIELWKSNGGPLGTGGTKMVADINPGAAGSIGGSPLTNVNGTLFFSATNGSTGLELWRTAVEGPGAAVTPPPPAPPAAAAATGQRASALKKCKKKPAGKKRKKCKRKAKRLPV
jgi:ELWxxDGT repeat protein